MVSQLLPHALTLLVGWQERYLECKTILQHQYQKFLLWKSYGDQLKLWKNKPVKQKLEVAIAVVVVVVVAVVSHKPRCFQPEQQSAALITHLIHLFITGTGTSN